MNTYARMKDPERESTSRKNYRRNMEKGNSAWRLALPIIGIVFLVCGSCLLRVYFRAKTESLTRETAILENRIKVQRQEIACLRHREAQFTTRSHVMSKLRHAGLRAPEYGQVTHVALLPPPGYLQKRAPSSLASNTGMKEERNLASNYKAPRR